MKRFQISNFKFQILAAAIILLCPEAGFADSNTPSAGPADVNAVKNAIQAKAAVENWRDLRFGLFIHWGPVSLKGKEISWSRDSEIPKAEYDNLYKQFNPEKFSAAEWVSLAKKTGVKYIVIAAKHHDGFCLWDSKYTDYDIMSTPFGRDVLGELSSECKKEGIKFGVYYSICDWHHPDYPSDSPGGQKT
jgi:alpha-L-fucosidase